jgi:hypothetical protein
MNIIDNIFVNATTKRFFTGVSNFAFGSALNGGADLSYRHIDANHMTCIAHHCTRQKCIHTESCFATQHLETSTKKKRRNNRNNHNTRAKIYNNMSFLNIGMHVWIAGALHTCHISSNHVQLRLRITESTFVFLQTKTKQQQLTMISLIIK